MKTKICARCKQELTIDNFYIAKSGKINSYCKNCDKERKKNNKPIEPPKDLTFYKVCSCCGKKKLATEFNKHIRRKDGLSTQCKDCDHKLQKQYAEKYKDNKIPSTKICSMCKKEKPSSEFSYCSRNLDRLNTYCKDCCKEHFTNNRQQYAEQHKINLPENYTKICNICKTAKPASEFYKSSYNVDGLQYTCKECEKREERKIYNLNYSRQIVTKKCKICDSEYQAARSSSDRCPNCRQHTIPEEIFIQILKHYDIKYETEFRVNKQNVWCDFYLPEYNMLIDINPTATHSTLGKEGVFEAKPKDYHINRKTIAVTEGYKYISLWDWDNPEDIVKAIKENRLNVKENETKLFWCRNNLNSLNWGKYPKDVYKLDNNYNESQMIAEGYLPVYDDGQTLIY